MGKILLFSFFLSQHFSLLYNDDMGKVFHSESKYISYSRKDKVVELDKLQVFVLHMLCVMTQC